MMEAGSHHTSTDSRIPSERSSTWQTNDLAAAFAMAVTVPANDCVARRGKESIYAEFCKIFSEAYLRPGESTKRRSKEKISEAAFNKALQTQCGFKCVRTRQKRLAGAASNWLFCHRRWLNPEDIGDAKVLSESYERLRLKFTDFRICAKTQFMQVLTKVTKSWSNWKYDISEKLAQQNSPEDYEMYANLNETAQRIQSPEISAKVLPRRNSTNYTGGPKASEIVQARNYRFRSGVSGEQSISSNLLNAGQLVDAALDRMLMDQMLTSRTSEELEESWSISQEILVST